MVTGVRSWHAPTSCPLIWLIRLPRGYIFFSGKVISAEHCSWCVLNTFKPLQCCPNCLFWWNCLCHGSLRHFSQIKAMQNKCRGLQKEKILCVAELERRHRKLSLVKRIGNASNQVTVNLTTVMNLTKKCSKVNSTKKVKSWDAEVNGISSLLFQAATHTKWPNIEFRKAKYLSTYITLSISECNLTLNFLHLQCQFTKFPLYLFPATSSCHQGCRFLTPHYFFQRICLGTWSSCTLNCWNKTAKSNQATRQTPVHSFSHQQQRLLKQL